MRLRTGDLLRRCILDASSFWAVIHLFPAVRDKTYWVYILTNASSTVLYVGMTSELATRVAQHKDRTDPDCFTARYRTDRLVHAEPFGDVHEAIRREKQLKGWSRAKKRALIDATNPSWRDVGPATPSA